MVRDTFSFRLTTQNQTDVFDNRTQRVYNNKTDFIFEVKCFMT
jgi:hypothetical protein